MPSNPPKRVLMICYYFSPIITPGTARSTGFVRHLQEFGWLPTVLTVQNTRDPWVVTGEPIPSDPHIVRSAELNLMGIVTFAHGVVSRCARLLGIKLKINYFYDLLCLPDPQIAWLCIPAGIRLARSSDAIFATCSPFSSALVGCLIKAVTGKPLIVDFRDPWSFNAYNNHSPLHFTIARKFERWVVKRCDRLVLNTPAALRLYQDAYPDYADKFAAIPNGYDLLPPPPLPPSGNRFSIVHVGTFYGTRSPTLLLQALTEIANADIEFVQIGAPCDGIEPFKDKVSIRTLPVVSRMEAVERMRSASLLYLKQGPPRYGRAANSVAAKTYEYLASGVPILADVPPGGDADLVREHARNSYLITSGSKQEIKDAILAAYARRLSIEPGVDPKYVKRYSRATLTKRLAALLDEAVATSAGDYAEQLQKQYECD